MLLAPSCTGRIIFHAAARARLVALKVVSPLGITSSDSKYLSRVRSVGADAANALGLLARQTHPIVGCDPFAVSSTELGIVNVTSISLGLGCVVEGFPIFGA